VGWKVSKASGLSVGGLVVLPVQWSAAILGSRSLLKMSLGQ
jgi:hypothetical protein